MSLNIKEINELLNIHIDYYKKIKELQKKSKINFRLPNFPESISENLVKEYILQIENRNCIKSLSGGDLQIINDKKLKVEVKCFTSTGPTSFGPTESWDEIYFIDAINFINKEFKIYKINLANNSNKFQKIKINANETYQDVCDKGKRPRIGFLQLKNDLIKNNENITEVNIKIINDIITIINDTNTINNNIII